MPHVEVEPDVRLFAQDLGAGPAVVLIAGFGLSHPVWDAEVRELTAAGHRAVCVDLRGTGASDKPLHGYELERLADDVEAALRELDVSSATLVGWSFGGQVAFELAARGGSPVEKLVLVSSGGVRAGPTFGASPDKLLATLQAGERDHRLAARRKTITSGFAGDPDPEVLRFLIDVQLRMPSWAALACYETYLLSDREESLARITVPVLQIFGAEDAVTPLDSQQWLAERLIDSCLVPLKDCGHYPMFEAGSDFRAALLDFVGR